MADPVGYISYTLPGNSETLLPLQLARNLTFMGYVNQVTPAGVRFSANLPTGVFGSVGRGYMEVRVGAMAGLGIPATGFSGNFLNLERSPVGLVSVGDYVSIREEWTLGGLFETLLELPFESGESAAVADTLSVWDARTQTSRVFYLHTGLGWREADKLAEGDKSQVPVLFPSGVIVRRRAATDVQVVVTGQVIMPLDQRYHPVWPGRNIISAPFTSSPNLNHYIRPVEDAPHTVVSGLSAPSSDTLRFYTYDLEAGTKSISPVIYYGNGQWRVVGSNENAGETSLSFSPCLDLQRVGPAGYIRFQGIPYESAAASQKVAAAVSKVVKEDSVTLNKSAGGLTLRWPSKAGSFYQIQSRPVWSGSWEDFKASVQATSSEAAVEFAPEGNACFRVIEL